MKSSKLPDTDSIRDLARFWDSHDLTEFDDELEEVESPVFERNPGAKVVLRLAPREIQAVREIAEARGVEQSELVREWVLEKLGSIHSGALRPQG